MPEIDVYGRPLVSTYNIGRFLEETELRLALTAGDEATVRYGGLTRTSRDGRTVLGRERVLGAGWHQISLTSHGGPLSLTVEAGDDRLVDFRTDSGPAAYRWRFVGTQIWSGGSVNEEAHEIARLELEGKPLPSRPVGPSLPAKGLPVMPSYITRPFAPHKDIDGFRPTKAINPVEDDPA